MGEPTEKPTPVSLKKFQYIFQVSEKLALWIQWSYSKGAVALDGIQQIQSCSIEEERENLCAAWPSKMGSQF